MAAVIQAACPGCKKILRIPADWIHHAIRCKHCGLVMAAKHPPAVAAHTPAPEKRPASPPPLPKPPQAVQATPLPPTVNKLTPPAAPVARLVAASPAAAPLAVPVAPLPGSPFAKLEAPAPVAQPLLEGGGWWKGPVIACVVLAFAAVAIAGAVFLPVLGKRLLPATPQHAAHNDAADGKDHDGNEPPDTPPAEPVKKPEPKVEPKPPDPKKPDPDKKPDPKKPDPEPKRPDPKPPDPIKKPDPDPKLPPPKPDKKPDPPPAGATFPRRALVISVHNYLYANPVGAGIPAPGARDLRYFVTRLGSSLKIPAAQVAHLSDEAGKDKARAPVKEVIQRTLDDFLTTSRDQDRVVVVFIGHAVEIEGEGYLVPIEGELGNAATLIPLKWVYEELKNCKARQKVLVLDCGRFNRTHGVERPGSFPQADDLFGAMTAKFDEQLKNPPAGVQVWTACVAGQMSYETDSSQVGLFIDKLVAVLEKGAQGAPRPEEAIPVEKLNDLVTAAMKDDLAKYKLTQTPRATGKEADGGAAYNADAAPPPEPKLASSPHNKENTKLIREVLAEISTPPVKGGHQFDATVKFEMLPPFSEKALKNYGAGERSEVIEAAIKNARAMLWAVSSAPPPAGLEKEVQAAREKLGGKTLAILRDGFRYPDNENRLKTEIMNHSRDVADILDELQDAYKKLTDVEFERDKEPKRWVANYDFIVARMEEQIAYLYEYQSMLGQMRKELPPIERPLYNGWKLASTPAPSGDTAGKKLAKSSAKLLDKIAAEHKGTPWEVLAKREKLTTLGLEWKAATVK
jgi:outer membrane biosynthesis protein TonB